MNNWDTAAERLAERYTPEHWEKVVLADEETLANVVKELIRVTDTPAGRGPRQLPELAAGRALLDRLTNPDIPHNYATDLLPVELARIKAEDAHSDRTLAATLSVSRSLVQRVLGGEMNVVSPATIRHFGETLRDNDMYFVEARAHLLAAAIYHITVKKPRLALDLITELHTP